MRRTGRLALAGKVERFLGRREGYGRQVTIPFRLLRDALTQLSLDPRAQRSALAGSVVTDELALDLDNALLSLQYESERTGIVLDNALVTALRDLGSSLDVPPGDPLWDDESIDTHPTWAAARRIARQLLPKVASAQDAAAEPGR
jgi:hypothetical protein